MEHISPQLSTAQLARLIEDFVIAYLAAWYKANIHAQESAVFVTVFSVYSHACDQSFGKQITAGFFNKAIADMAAAGIVERKTFPGDVRYLALSYAKAVQLGIDRRLSGVSK